ncbi:hypothetical protein [Autumnicola musiva]|uniref:Lipoprotein n=1 Tax=Autumnicola musiva TaxID=3075589 RepID=A0ABU3D4X4_9FLAO|nr:hypothetical protein [Zunongwangia sp. F117]MDT0676587.1 hypothetical protein [Zunongwangia sp. F117]
MKKGLFITLTVLLFSACKNQYNIKTNAALPEYMKIVNGQTTINDSSIVCELSLKQLPTQLRFNSNGLKVNAREYEWGVYFDNNNDGNYDLSLAVSNWKSEKKKEKEGEILKYTQTNIWKIENEGGSNIGYIDSKIEGDKIILTALFGANKLNEISSSSKIKYQTYYNSGTETYKDSLIIEN